MESFSLYIHISSRSKSFLSYVDKSYGALKIPKMACSKLVKIFEKILDNFFPSLYLLKGRYLIIKRYSFYFTLLGQLVLKL